MFPSPVRALRGLTALALAASLAACGGGGGGTVPTPASGNITQTPAHSGQSLGLTFAGTQTLARVRRTQDLTATPVTVSVNGVVVGTGTLDGKGHAKITFTVTVPPGATVTIVAGALTVTATIATTSANTAVLVTVNADGSVKVTSAADPAGTGVVTPNQPEREDQTEDGKGNVTDVTANDATALPTNAFFTLVRTCTTLTLTPASALVASIKFEEKGSDGESDDAGRVHFEGAFTGPLTFPIDTATARLHIELFDAQHKRLIEVKAPISAVTGGPAAGASPCPSPSATATASATARASATPHPSTSPRASASPEPSKSPEPRESPEPTEAPEHSPSPVASATATATPSAAPTATPRATPTPPAR